MGNLVVPETWKTQEANEGSLRRAARDAWGAITTPWFFVEWVVMSALVSILTAGFIFDAQNSNEARAAVTGGTIIVGAMVAVALLFAVLAAITPYRQRDEARHQRDVLKAAEEKRPRG